MSDKSGILNKFELLKFAFEQRFTIGFCQLSQTDAEIAITTSWFILVHYINTNDTVIRFVANLRPSTAAIVSQIICLVFPRGDFRVDGDYYVTDAGDCVFDDDAFYAYEEDKQAAFGKKRCYICDRFKDVEELNSEGRCKICATYNIEFH